MYWRKRGKRSLIYMLKDRTAWERIEGLEVGEEIDHRSLTVRLDDGIRKGKTK